MGKLLPLLLAVTGLVGGVAAGFIMQPETGEPEADCAAEDCPPGEEVAATPPPIPVTPAEFIKLPNQFVVPVVAGNSVNAMVVLTLSLEVDVGSQESVYAIEPKLRDGFLRVLFDHANMGGFEGNFLRPGVLEDLRNALRESGRKNAGPILRDVLIVDIVKQTI